MAPHFRLVFFSKYCTCIIRSSDTVVLIKNISFITGSNFFCYRAGIDSSAARCLQTVVRRSYTGVNMALSQCLETCCSYYIKNNCFFFSYIWHILLFLCSAMYKMRVKQKWCTFTLNKTNGEKHERWVISLLGRAVFSPVCLVVKVCIYMWACSCR